MLPGDLQRLPALWKVNIGRPYLAHAPLEPMNAVVRIENGEADVWSGTQGVGVAQGLVSRFSGIPVEKVRSYNTYLGGAFGRRGTLTHIIETTEVAVATGKLFTCSGHGKTTLNTVFIARHH